MFAHIVFNSQHYKYKHNTTYVCEALLYNQTNRHWINDIKKAEQFCSKAQWMNYLRTVVAIVFFKPSRIPPAVQTCGGIDQLCQCFWLPAVAQGLIDSKWAVNGHTHLSLP